MFTDKVIIVTGAAGNVGSAVARLLASRGARIAAVDALGPPLIAVMETLENPKRHLPLPEVNLADQAACEDLVARVVQVLGGLHGVATTVGGFAMSKLADTSLEQWDQMFSLNVKTTWNIYRAAVSALKGAGGGSLVGIGSAAGLRGSAEMAPYAATKSAAMRLTESLADELRPDRIRVMPSCPPRLIRHRIALPCRYSPLGEAHRSGRGHAVPVIRRREWRVGRAAAGWVTPTQLVAGSWSESSVSKGGHTIRE